MADLPKRVAKRPTKKTIIQPRAEEGLVRESVFEPTEEFIEDVDPSMFEELLGRPARPEELARQRMAQAARAELEGERAPREQTGAANSGGATDAAFNGALLDPRTDDILYSLAELRYQNQEQRYSTDIMVRDQQGILDKLKKMDQNNYLKALELKKNQNPVLDVNPYIQHNDDIATAQRRAAEEIKYQQDYFTRAEQMSQIMTEQQYLTQQIYANEHWGIPSLQGITYGDGEYFTSR